MNHTDLVEKVAEATEVPKAVASRAVEAMVQTIIHTLKAGEEVRISGLGIFDVNVREPRPGRNPQDRREHQHPRQQGVTVSRGKGG
jgi:DNA-binding protein HU-beta